MPIEKYTYPHAEWLSWAQIKSRWVIAIRCRLIRSLWTVSQRSSRCLTAAPVFPHRTRDRLGWVHLSLDLGYFDFEESYANYCFETFFLVNRFFLPTTSLVLPLFLKHFSSFSTVSWTLILHLISVPPMHYMFCTCAQITSSAPSYDPDRWRGDREAPPRTNRWVLCVSERALWLNSCLLDLLYRLYF